MATKKHSGGNASAWRLRSEPVADLLEALFERAGSLLGALGLFVVAGAVIAAFSTWFFSEIAETVMSGGTQSFDEMVLRWIHAQHTPALDATMIEITALGTGTVVLMIVCVAAFLVLV